MTIIDSQVHVYEANTPKRPWHSVPNWPDHVTGDEMVASMDKVGVDGAIFISAFSMYQYDASYAVEVQQAHPSRFALVKPVNPDDPAVADVIAEWKRSATRPTRASTGSRARPCSTISRSTCCAGAMSTPA
jgi:predicted TIM-barrel fold metal-dependent hydrolase